MQNNVKYVFTHFVKYVTLDRLSTPTIARFIFLLNLVSVDDHLNKITLDRSSAPTHYDEYLNRAIVVYAYMRSVNRYKRHGCIRALRPKI